MQEHRIYCQFFLNVPRCFFIVMIVMTMCLASTSVQAQNSLTTENSSRISVWRGDDYPYVYYFPIDRHLLMRDWRNNNKMLGALDEMLTTSHIVENIDTIVIIGACSPVASEEYNRQLALNRCMALRSYLRWKHLDVAERFPIQMNVTGIDHVGYAILNKRRPPLTEKEKWDMLQYAAIGLKMKNGTYIVPGADKPEYSVPSRVICDTIYLKCDTVFLKDTVTIYKNKHEKPFHFALKTNLIYDAALLPNLTAEFWLGNRWSLAVEGNWSWWTFDNPVQNRWYHRIQAAGAELRYWVKSPYPLNGHALGAYYMFGDYDIRLLTDDEYSKGWLSYGSWTAGLSYAYSMPIARKFNLEFGLAFGYLGGKYYRYDYCLRHEEWTQRAVYSRNYWGPARVGISLVWLPFTGNRKKDNK